MDPISQGVLGASAAQSAANRRDMLVALLAGIVGGMAPDLDSLIRSADDPLLYLEYHRQFTHSLVFIPMGGLLCALVLKPILRAASFGRIYLFATLGYATHGLLDSCTTYGTQLFWPFSDARVAWHVVSIIDPLFTLPMVGAVVLASWKRSAWFARLACGWAVLYLAAGIVQRERAESIGQEIAAGRSHIGVEIEAKPSFANIMVWKIIYAHDGKFYVDAVRLGIRPEVYPGASLDRLDLTRDFPWLDPNSQQARDVERFRWFSNHHLAVHPRRRDFVIDMRYSLLPNGIDGMWGIELNPQAAGSEHVRFLWARQVGAPERDALWRMIMGNYQP